MPAKKGSTMLESNADLRSCRTGTLVFAILSGLSAVFTAVVPIILHI